MDRILRLPAVLAATGLCRSALYKAIQDGNFPKQVRLSSRAVGWRESDIARWIESRQQAKTEG